MIKEVVLSFLVATTSVDKVEVDKFRHSEATCLAKNMYYESRNQGLAGQLAVSLVVMNRVKDSRYPNTVCGVVEQGPTRESWKKNGTYYPIRNRCQFSWFCDGKSDEPKEPTTYKRLLDLALVLVYDDIQIVDFTEGATHYHADYVFPAWRKSKTKTVEIADHIFYRWEK
jgi:N-acetylmuramoyl-L-alanine amidase